MDELKTLIRALAISNAASGITVAQLNKDFKALEGYPIPYSKFGFQSLDGMLRTMTDAVRVSGYGVTAVIQPLTNEKTQHVRDMVKKSKPLKKKPSQNYRSPETNCRNNFYDNHYSSHLDDFIEHHGHNGKPANTNGFYTNNVPSSNVQKQQLRNDHRNDSSQKHELPKTPIQADKSVTKPCVNSAQTNNEREKTPQEMRNNNFHKDDPSKTRIQAYKSVTTPCVKSAGTNNHPEKTPDKLRNNNFHKDELPNNPIPTYKSATTPCAKSTEKNNQREQTADETINNSLHIDELPKSPIPAYTSIKSPDKNNQREDTPDEMRIPLEVKPNSTVQVVVTSVLNPRHLYVHFKEHTNKLVTLAPYIDAFYSTKTTAHQWSIPEQQVKVGLYCAAQYHGRWYRARVMSPVNHQRVLLLYIDYGYLRYVPLTEMRFLAKDFTSIPHQSVRIALKYVKPSNGTWSRECCEQLASLVHRKVFEMHVLYVDVQENLLEVILTQTTNDSVDSFVHNSGDGNLNSQLALRDDIVWSAD